MSSIQTRGTRSHSLARHARDTVRLAAPLAITQLSQMAMSITDTAMLGSLGAQALAAGGLAASLGFSITMLLQGVLSSLSVTVSHARGSSEESLVPRIYWTGLVLAGLLSIVAFGILSVVEPVLIALGEPASLAQAVAHYCLVLRWSAPATLVGIGVMRAFLPAIGAAERLLWVSVAGVFINAFLNYGLINGAFGLPRLGFLGSALATTLTLWVSALALLVLLHTRLSLRHWVRMVPPHWPVLGELFAIGWPVAITYGVEVMFFLCASMMAGWMGAGTLAAHQIALNIASVAFMVPLALGQAANVRVAYWLGAGKPEAARHAGFVALALGAGFMAIAACTMVLIPRQIIGLYVRLDDPANAMTVALAIELLRVAALFQIVDGIQVVGSGCLRAFQDTRIPMCLAAFGYWGIGLPVGYFLGVRQGEGALGLWWGFAAGLASVALLMILRFGRISALRLLPD
jgi:MATE family multidrug resistance protein